MKTNTYKYALIFNTLITLYILCACGEPTHQKLNLKSVTSQNTQENPVDHSVEDVNINKSDNQASDNIHTSPIKALYITNYTNAWHDYESQKTVLIDAISRSINIEFDLVGKNPNDALNFMSTPNFAKGYDVIIYNMCFADDFNTERINNIISQTRDDGIPAVLLHCSMHSFQQTSPNYPEQQLELMAEEWEWDETHPNVEFPYWWRFTGIDTLSHDWSRGLTVSRTDEVHPITSSLPHLMTTQKDELYRNLLVKEDVIPLYTAYSTESKREHIVAWTHTVGVGRVFATTLGHNHHTMYHNTYHQLVANGIAYVTGHLTDQGWPSAKYQGTEPTENYQATVVCQPTDVIDAQTIEQVQSIVSQAFTENRTLKVISVPKSNSNSEFICPKHGGILLNLAQMNHVVSLDEDRLTVTVQPGIKAVELSQYLHHYGFAIPTMPDYTGVSIAGGIATAAHHSSLQFPSSMADMVESILLVNGQGELQRFDGVEASTAAVHLGMLGVVVEITLRIEPQFKLQYGFEQGRDDDLESQIEAMVRAHDYARVMWFVGNGRYVFDYYDRVNVTTPGTSKHNIWTSTGSVFRFVGDLPYRILNRAPLRAQCDSALLRSRIWSPPFEVQESPTSTPVGWSHQMLGSDCQPGRCPWSNDSVRSRTMEASFPLSQLSEWMSDVRAIIHQRRACFPILGIYLRFSKASDRWLGFNYGSDVVSFEIHVPKVATETYQERSADVYDEIMQMTLARYNARPHWGKNSTPMFLGIGVNQYPRWNDFIALKQQLDPLGMFDNRIWQHMNKLSEVRSYPSCVLSRDCICSEDAHCGEGYRCDVGGAYTAARVCREK